MNVNEFAKVGDTVFYTGEIKYALNSDTVKGMKKNLIAGDSYEVKHITRYKGVLTHHYLFRGDAFLYPCESFTKYIQVCATILYKLK